MAIVVLLSDFGISDPYVGIMKSVLRSIAPEISIIDLSHGVTAHDITAGALALQSAWSYLQPNSVVCAVIDPGVGSNRDAIAMTINAEDCARTLVCPNNCLATLVQHSARSTNIGTLDQPRFHLEHISATFHSRDIFAPVAARLALGYPFSEVGTPISPTELIVLSLPQPRTMAQNREITILYVDSFGNLLTNLSEGALDNSKSWLVEKTTCDFTAPLRKSYSDVPSGTSVAYWGSSGYLELAVSNGKAAHSLGLGVGDELLVNPSQTCSGTKS
jgi:S-adenosylmethionine hydrolase